MTRKVIPVEVDEEEGEMPEIHTAEGRGHRDPDGTFHVQASFDGRMVDGRGDTAMGAMVDMLANAFPDKKVKIHPFVAMSGAFDEDVRPS